MRQTLGESCSAILGITSSLLVLMTIATTIVGHRSFVSAFSEDVTCVLRPKRFTDDQLEGMMSWACGAEGGVDCTPIRSPNGSHYHPNTPRAHCDWVVNQYFQQNRWAYSMSTCDFDGAAMLQCPQNSGTGLASNERIIGANIGGFLVLEPWIVPKLFDQFVNRSKNETAIDEYTFAKVLGKEEATKQLTAHWESWVTKADFEKLVEIGVTHIRVPYGYWIFGDVEPFVRGIEQLDRTLDLAKEVGLKVLLDLHGAVGSQNGFDNSGRACEIGGKPCYIPCPAHASWGRDGAYGETVNQTLLLLERVATRYANHSAVWGMELLNEPRSIEVPVLKSFYTRGYHVIRNVTGAGPSEKWKIVIHDGFYTMAWRDFMLPAQGFHGVMLDVHIYQAFVPWGGDQSLEQHLERSCQASRTVDYMNCRELPLIVGEWSLATTDCTLWLDGYKKPALSDHCQNRPPIRPMNGSFLREYATYQMSSYYRGHGWFFWNFKTAASPEWNLIHAYEQGWLPDLKSNITTTTTPGNFDQKHMRQEEQGGNHNKVTGLSKRVIEACNFSQVPGN